MKELRTFLGCMAGPWTGWLLLRSLETLKPRMGTQARNAALVAQFLEAHPKVTKAVLPGSHRRSAQERIFQAQCEAGSHAELPRAGR